MPGASTTGDIIWRKLDPKTFYLYNEPPKPDEEASTSLSPTEPSPEGGGAGSGDLGSDWEQSVLGKRGNELEKKMFQHDMAIYGPERAMERAVRHMHTRQLAELNHDLRENPDGVDHQTRIQELLDTGALRIDERGDLYSSIPLSPHANERILESARIWQPQDQPDTDIQSQKEGLEQQIANYEAMTPTTLGPQGE